MKSIQESVQKIKSEKGLLLLTITMAILCLSVGIMSFIFGRLSVQTGPNDPNTVDVAYPPLVAQYEAIPREGSGELGQNNGQYVASISGTKYYTLGCSGVSRIKEENKTYFNSTIEAENAGYEPSTNCF